jgi:hypothetical protein
VVGRQGVRTDVDHLAVGIEPQQTVARPRTGVHLARVLRRRERAVGDHLEQIVSGVHIGGLQQAALPADHAAGVPLDDGDHLVEVTHRDDLPPDPVAGDVDRWFLGHHPLFLPGMTKQREVRERDERRHPVVGERRHSGGRASLGRADQQIGLRRHP